MLKFANKIVLFSLLFLSIFSCKKERILTSDLNQKEYKIQLFFDSEVDTLIKLYSLTPKIQLQDSARTFKDTVIFKDSIKYPERYLLSIGGIINSKLIILSMDSISISVANGNLNTAIISDSPINDELIAFQNKSKRITSKIDLLFPELQRARLNNDIEKLEEISNKIQVINQENIDFSFDYVNKHPSSFVSTMILNDLSKRDSIDMNQLKSAFKNLSEKVKKGADGIELTNKLFP